MSGGHFDYYNQYVGTDMDGQWLDAEMNALFRDLFVSGEFSPRSYGGLALSLDFMYSGDTDEETYREDLKRFKRKWMHRTPRNRIDFYKDEIQKFADQCKEELDL